MAATRAESSMRPRPCSHDLLVRRAEIFDELWDDWAAVLGEERLGARR